MKTFAIVGVTVAVLAVGFGGLRVSGLWDRVLQPAPRRVIDFATLDPGHRPNHYLVCPPGLCQQATPHAESPIFPVSVDRLAEAFREMVSADASISIEEVTDDTLELVQRTNVMRWPDRITIRFIAAGPEEAVLAVYSRSTYGYSDMGANKARITRWLDRMSERLP